MFEGMVTGNDLYFHKGRFSFYIEERMGSVLDLMGWFLCILILTGQVYARMDLRILDGFAFLPVVVSECHRQQCHLFLTLSQELCPTPLVTY